MAKVTAIGLNQTVQVDKEISIKAHYAGHVLGAAMFEVRVGHLSFVYTGDYNTTPDRHLGPAFIDKCYPDLLITESTYATTIRDSKYCRERSFFKKLSSCLANGGKVLIPVFVLGRAQELCLLLENYWDRMGLDVPIYLSPGIGEKALEYYKMFSSWMNRKIKKSMLKEGVFDFKHIKVLDRSYIDHPGPMVILASPGMLHAGQSLEIFKRWCTDEKNMLIMPGYCVKGTIGQKVLLGLKQIEIDQPQLGISNKPKTVEIKMAIEYLSFSAHADAKGIMQLIDMCRPKNVLLVHGEAEKMNFISKKIKKEFKIDCFMPENGETTSIPVASLIPVHLDYTIFKEAMNN
ncbi:MAG: Integrator complex subunit 11, partial [Paramarteilia canceri]